MKIAISVTRNDIHSRYDRRFGRCPWFLVWDTLNLEGRFVRNSLSPEAKDAGKNAADLLSQWEVEAVFSGAFGNTAMRRLRECGINMFLLRDDGLTLADILKLRDKNFNIQA